MDSKNAAQQIQHSSVKQEDDAGTEQRGNHSLVGTAATVGDVLVIAEPLTGSEGVMEIVETGQLENVGSIMAAGALSNVATVEEEKVIVGQHYIEELKSEEGKMDFSCRLCERKLEDRSAVRKHLLGLRHRLAYKEKVDPSLVVDVRGTISVCRLGNKCFSTWVDWRDKRRGIFGGGPMPWDEPNLATRKMEKTNDRQVLLREGQIRLLDAEKVEIESQLSTVTKCLSLVIDELGTIVNSAAKVPPVGLSTGTKPQLIHEAIKPVGLWAKGLLLHDDRELELVVLCSQHPTLKLLAQVAQSLSTHLTDLAPSVTYTVAPYPDKAFVEVKAIKGHGLVGDLVIKIWFTSEVLAENPLEDGVAVGETEDCYLNRKDCLFGLDLVRRVKWFQDRLADIKHLATVVRVMRDLCLRDPAWSTIDSLAVELIVERAASCNENPLSPGVLLYKALEMVSDGIFLSFGDKSGSETGNDAWEKKLSDATSNLNALERERITASASGAWRRMLTGKLFKVLGMEDPSLETAMDEHILNLREQLCQSNTVKSPKATRGRKSMNKKRPRGKAH